MQRLHSLLSFATATVLIASCVTTSEPAWSPAVLQSWHEEKASLGPTFAGSPAWDAHIVAVETLLSAAGVVEVQKYPAPYTRWWTSDASDSPERGLVIAGEELPVASYWAYSGSTPTGGVSAELLLYTKGMPRAALRDRIVVFEVDHVPAAMGKMFAIGNAFATEDFAAADPGIADDQWYQGNYVTRFGRWDELLKDSGAAGAIVIYSMSAARLRGLYTFPLLNTGIVGVPGIYVDAQTGARVRAAAMAGQRATLTLVARTESVEPYFYTAVLPGRDYGTAQDEQILLVTHSDGPSLSQENGTLGIAALVRHFAARPAAARPRSLRVLFDPQHYSPGRHTINWYDAHPELMARVVASVGVEQLGQREFGETVGGYGLTGHPEPWQLFVRDDPALINAALAAITEGGLPRTELRIPERKGQGMWTGLGDVAIKRDLPGFATLSSMSGYWSTSAGIESFDAALADRQLVLLARLTDFLLQQPL